MRRYALCVVLLLAVTVPVTAQMAGTWKGLATAVSTGCDPDTPNGGPVTFTVDQNGSNISGTVSFRINSVDCHPVIPGQTASAPFTGSVSGDSFSGQWEIAPGEHGTFSGTVSGNEMTLAFSVGDTSGVGQLSRTTVPGNVAGSWNGGFAAVATECNPKVAQSGAMSISLTQNGSSVSGTIIVQATHECSTTPSGETFSIPLQAQMDGNLFSASITVPPGLPGEIHGFVRGDELMSAFAIGDTLGVAFMSRGSTSTGLTGTWTGSMKVDNFCGSTTLSFESPATLSLVQTGSELVGNILIEAERSQDGCVFGEPFPIAVAVGGTVSGNSIDGFLITPEEGEESMPGTVSGSSMTLTLSGEEESRVFRLTRTSSSDPSGPLTGTYSGNWTGQFSGCCRLPLIQTGGTFTTTLLHTGRAVTGNVLITGGKTDSTDQSGNCLVSDAPPDTAVLGGIVEGNDIELYLGFGGGDLGFLSGTITPSTFNANQDEGDCPGETNSFSLNRTQETAPAILSFTATPSTIALGRSSTLTWSTFNATTVTIEPGLGSRAPSGSVLVTPAATTTYTLTATNPSGSVTSTAIVTVTVTPAEVVVTQRPAGMVQEQGGAFATDSYTLTNVGGTATTITLQQTGSFFTQSPSSFALAPGASQVVTFTSVSQQAIAQDGMSIPSGTGVPAGLTIPVHLFVSTRPSGTTQPRATTTRVVTAGGVQVTQGAVHFTNHGTATVSAIAVSDAPWLNPQAGIITIPPAQTVTVNFTIDPSKRPDSADPIGGATGSISLRFLEGTSTSATDVTAQATTLSNVSVSIVSVVTPVTNTETPGTLGEDELAYFVSGLGSQLSSLGDLLVSFRGSEPNIGSLKMFSAAAGSTLFKSATFSNLSTFRPLSFPAIASSIFGSTQAMSSVQLRSPDISKVSVAATRVNNANSTGSYAEALPILRSDRAVGANGQIVLSGALKMTGIQTNLYLQAVNPNAATVRVELLADNGSVVSTRSPVTVRGWEMVELADVSPANATAIRITNTSSNQARIAAYGLVIAPSTGETWVLEDPVTASGSSPDTFYVPITTPGTGAETYLFVTNRGTVDSAVTVDVIASKSRRRAVRSASSSGSALNVQTDAMFTLAPGASQTIQVTSTTRGYVRVRAGAGALSLAARSGVPADSKPVPYGGSLPAMPSGSALATGQSARFTGIEDTASASGPGAFRSNLLLIETTGSTATVRVRLDYSFSASTKATAVASSTRDFTITGSSFLEIKDIIGSVIGPVRSAFGDLHAIQMDVEVVGGDGRVIAFVRTVDGGSGDLVVRTR